jgi:hypothetical protein
MLRMKSVGAAVATVLALVALAPVASASGGIKAVRLQVEGTPLAVGAPIAASSSNLSIANAYWSFACTETTLSGTVGANNLAKNDFLPITEGLFAGGGNEGRCASTFDFVSTWQPAPMQPPELQLNRKAEALLRFPRVRLIPEADINNPAGQKEACTVSSNGFKGSFGLSETPQPLTVTFTNAKTHIEGGHGAECGHGKNHSPFLSGTFTFTSGGLPVEVVIFEHN